MADQPVTSTAKVAKYRAAIGVFSGLLAEMRELSKKKADATLSKGKVKILNRVLEDLKEVLGDEAEAKYLDFLDEDDLPQNSDAVLVMVQYEKALKAFNGRYRAYDKVKFKSYWMTESTSVERDYDD
ncbi:MAG: hypothetical protein KGZ72_15010 [Roseovarius sp.]|jgi:hypothetical protein|nr:hypothetical protein [Roseovarius sp.]